MMTTTPPSAASSSTTWIPSGDAETVEYKNGIWQPRRTKSLEDLPPSNGIAIIFVSTAQVQQSADTDRVQSLAARVHHIPMWFWKAKVQNASGYFYGHQSTATDFRHITVSHFLIKYATGASQQYGLEKAYDWHKQSFLTVYAEGKQMTLMCFDVALRLREELFSLVHPLQADQLITNPFSIHGSILEHVVSLYDNAIWSFRDFVRKQEKQRPTIEQPTPDYVGMHELARHVMHSSEVSETALNVIDSILSELDRYNKNNAVASTAVDPAAEIRRQRSLLQGMHLRSRALEQRLQGEINLAFHISTQADSLVQLKIAAASQRDSNATRTISILGLVFLPGTFISAVFSMSFFNYTQATNTSPASWAMSSKFWIYWVVAIPVTLITIGVWWYWQQKTEKLAPKPPAKSHTIPINDPQHRPKSFTY